MLLGGYDVQNEISNRLGMPVDDVSDSSTIKSVTGETLQFYYFNSGVPTIDAGQAAGTVVMGVLANRNVMDRMGAMVGNDKETSLTFTTGTIFTTANIKPLMYKRIGDPTMATLSQIATEVTRDFATGEWCIDHRNGIVYGKKSTTGVSDTAAYKVRVKTADVTLEAGDLEIGAVELKNATTDDRANITAANTARAATDKVLLVQNIDAAGNVGSGGYAEDAAHVSGDKGTMILEVRRDTAASSAGTDGDYATKNQDALGHSYVREGYQSTSEDNTNGVIAIVNKPTAVSTYVASLFSNFGANATLNVKASSGNVFSISCHNTTGETRYLQLHNTATVPAGSAVPLYTFLVPANSAITLGTDFFGQNGLNFTTGIAFAISSAEGIYTAGAATDQYTFITYK